jgi:hypothetical protein
MGAAGRAKTLNCFTWEKATDRIEQVYKMAHANLQVRRSGPAR